VIAAHTDATKLPRRMHLLTFDAEHWYEGYRLRGFGGWERLPARDPATIERLLRLLAKHAQQATFFTTGRFAAEFPGVVRSIVVAGHEIASHGYGHVPFQLLGGRPAFRDDLQRSLGVLGDLAGQPIKGFRAPLWKVPESDRSWLFETLASEGLTYDSSQFAWGLPLGARARRPIQPYQVPLGGGRSLWEIPPSVLSLGPCRLPAAGGFYLRFFPATVVHAALRQAASAAQPGLIYLHPYDMDPSCPRLPARWYFLLMRYYRLGRTEGVLRHLLQTFRFTSITSWLASQQAAT
jgi:polysaccharide deacetylase family protein (PEP-CTERM system associated)